jgi:hypothetical protein
MSKYGPNMLPACNATLVDVSNNSETIFTGAGKVLGFQVETVLSAHNNIIADSTSPLAVTQVSLAKGTMVVFPAGGIKFNTSLAIDADDSATGKILLYWLED